MPNIEIITCCEQCGKPFKRGYTRGVKDAVQAKSNDGVWVKYGGIYDEPGYKYFCSPECAKAYWEAHKRTCHEKS